MTYQEVLDRIAERLGIPGSAASSLARIGRSINDVYREVSTSIGLDLSRRVPGNTAATTPGVQTVTFTGMEKIERLIDDTSGSIRVLTEVTYDQIQHINPALQDLAKKYAVESWTGTSVTIRLDVLPQTVYNLKADGYVTISTMVDSDVPAFPESFHDILIDGVLVDEYMRLEKTALADRAQERFDKRLSDLRMWRAKSITLTIRQAETRLNQFGGAAASGSGGGSGSSGSISYTQTGLITFDRDPDVPFAVTSGSAMVPNLNAEFLGGFAASDFATIPIDLSVDVTGDLPFGSLPQITSSRILGRATALTGDVEELTATGGIEFTATGIQTAAFTGDVTKSAGGVALFIAANAVTTAKILDDAVTDAKLRDSAACSVIGRSPNLAGTPTDITASTNNTLLARISNALSWVAGLVFDGAGRIQQIAFAAAQSASADANTLDDYEEGTWTPSLGGTATYTVQTGNYTKIGNTVTVDGHLTVNSIGSGSTGIISGLPFAAAAITAGSVGFFVSAASSLVFVSCYVNASTVIFPGLTGAATDMTNPVTFFGNGTDVYFSVTYKV